MYRPDEDDDDLDEFLSEDDFEYQDMRPKQIQHEAKDPRKEAAQQMLNAIRNGDLDTVRRILTNKLIEVDVSLESDWTPLMHAAFVSNPDIVRYLLNNGADPNYENGSASALFCACMSLSSSEVCNLACVKLLIDKNASVIATFKSKCTPIMKAIETGKSSVVSMLLPETDIESEDIYRRTPAFYAVLFDRPEILTLLIENGANLNVIDKCQNSLKSVALMRNCGPILKILDEYLTEKSEEEENDGTFVVSHSATQLEQMFPDLLEKERPAYWHEIPNLLYGMTCEKLVPVFEKNKIGLRTFLSLTNDDLNKMNVPLPYLQKRISAGLYKFHMYNWNSEVVHNRTEKTFDFRPFLQNVGSHLKHLTIISASYNYIYKTIEPNVIISDEIFSEILCQLSKIKKQVQLLKKPLLKINECNPPAADLITSRIPKNRFRYDMIKLFTISVSIICLFTFRSKIKSLVFL